MTKKCPKCTLDKNLDDFYVTKSRPSGAAYCKECFNKMCIQRWIDKKIKAIKYKGGKCADCKLTLKKSHYSVFEFHHLDPTQKDMEWTKMKLSNDKKMKEELDKCVLLCANCHRIRHSHK